MLIVVVFVLVITSRSSGDILEKSTTPISNANSKLGVDKFNQKNIFNTVPEFIFYMFRQLSDGKFLRYKLYPDAGLQIEDILVQNGSMRLSGFNREKIIAEIINLCTVLLPVLVLFAGIVLFLIIWIISQCAQCCFCKSAVPICNIKCWGEDGPTKGCVCCTKGTFGVLTVLIICTLALFGFSFFILVPSVQQLGEQMRKFDKNVNNIIDILQGVENVTNQFVESVSTVPVLKKGVTDIKNNVNKLTRLMNIVKYPLNGLTRKLNIYQLASYALIGVLIIFVVILVIQICCCGCAPKSCCLGCCQCCNLSVSVIIGFLVTLLACAGAVLFEFSGFIYYSRYNSNYRFDKKPEPINIEKETETDIEKFIHSGLSIIKFTHFGVLDLLAKNDSYKYATNKIGAFKISQDDYYDLITYYLGGTVNLPEGKEGLRKKDDQFVTSVIHELFRYIRNITYDIYTKNVIQGTCPQSTQSAVDEADEDQYDQQAEKERECQLNMYMNKGDDLPDAIITRLRTDMKVVSTLLILWVSAILYLLFMIFDVICLGVGRNLWPSIVVLNGIPVSEQTAREEKEKKKKNKEKEKKKKRLQKRQQKEQQQVQDPKYVKFEELEPKL
ncbi:MAG: hypothetical protein EZS28_015730 [Streblomastix strix]|uniref:Uncharacterized protein n=1 Tax=Streblomastix strix TaxID=222440 RepID=A0A5J4W2Q3_9EUKA|nr:MAG: hypothetical protein EZS28_015730 [Streblomastix strix]